jgi:hypothetical protein
MSDAFLTDPMPHCPSCTCESELDGLTIYSPNERLYGRCGTCGEERWATDFHTGGRGEPARSQHCGCCTHRHNLPNGGHDGRCLADESACGLMSDDRPVKAEANR